MTRIFQQPATFTEDMLEGFVDLHSQYVVRVPGGVVRATDGAPKVAVVIGGGSGHYPAFCGLVGPGFADGAVVGNIFTSPSAADAASVARAANAGRGVLLITGNYAGDVLNFKQAISALTAEGIEARFIVVTDDIASAPADEQAARRGIAGDFIVFKAAAAAAANDYDLDAVVQVANHANDRTRSLGVAFDGCTLPGADSPLFTVPKGRMALGLGIHGEPGIVERQVPTAAELAALFVDGILADPPQCGDTKLAVILNGLGATKYEELFLLWGHIAPRLRAAGYELCEPEVGELVTSLDMAGCSLTLAWLDEELERFWRAPADTPAYRKGRQDSQRPLARPRRERVTTCATEHTQQRTTTDATSRQCADTVLKALEAIRACMEEHAEELGRLDAVAGDGDHGRGMVKGTTAAVEAATQAWAANAAAGDMLCAAGDAWAASAGGTSGALWGAILVRLGERFADKPIDVAGAVRDAYEAASSLGGAKPGDKTMLDAFLPFSEELSLATASGQNLGIAWANASACSEQAARDTAPLRPAIGRARPLADRSVGHPDPGAISFALCVASAAGALAAGVA